MMLASFSALGLIAASSEPAHADGMPETGKFYCDIRSYDAPSDDPIPTEDEPLIDAIGDMNRSAAIVEGLRDIKKLLTTIAKSMPVGGADTRTISKKIREKLPTGWMHCVAHDDTFEKGFQPIVDLLTERTERREQLSAYDIDFLLQTVEALDTPYRERFAAENVVIAHLLNPHEGNPDNLIAEEMRLFRETRRPVERRIADTTDHRGERLTKKAATQKAHAGLKTLVANVTNPETTRDTLPTVRDLCREIVSACEAGVLTPAVRDELAQTILRGQRPWLPLPGQQRQFAQIEAAYGHLSPIEKLTDPAARAAYETCARENKNITRPLSQTTKQNIARLANGHSTKKNDAKTAAILRLDTAYEAKLNELTTKTRENITLVIAAQPERGFAGLTLTLPDSLTAAAIADETATTDGVFAAMEAHLRKGS